MHYPATRQNKNHKLLNPNGPLSQIIKKKKMQAYVNEFKEKKELKKATNEFCKRERERKMVTYTKIRIISLADSSKSYHFYGDSSCSQSELTLFMCA